MKINQIGNGATFIRPKYITKFVYMKINPIGEINAIELNSGERYIISDDEELELVII